MYQYRLEPLRERQGERYFVLRENVPLGHLDALHAMAEDGGFREFLSGLLSDAEHPAYCWETPPIREKQANQPFEFVLLPNERLKREPDRHSFADYFSNEHDVVTFTNLGGDAELVVPCPRAANEAYVHMASFVRSAPPGQIDRLWQATGGAMLRRIGNAPIWLSTAGMGVAWLHMRLDSRPKYYRYEPYQVDV